MRKIFGLSQVGDDEYRRQWNNELYEHYDDKDLTQRIEIRRPGWLGHVVRMDTKVLVLKLFDAVQVGGNRGSERPPLCWKDQVEKELIFLAVSNWRRVVRE